MNRNVWLWMLCMLPIGGVAVGSSPAGHGHEAAEEAANSNDPIRGIKLGEFLLRDFSPIEEMKMRLHFTLYAVVKREHAAAMEKHLHDHEARIRDHVLTAVRLVPWRAFEEPDLHTFRRRILLRLRRAMPDLEIEDLCLTDFNFLSR